MAFPTENFNSYADGDLNGCNGGTGWDGGWSGDTGYDVQGTTVQEGTKAVACTTNAQMIDRHFVANTIDDEIFSIYMRVSAALGASCVDVLYLNNLDVTHVLLQFMNDGYIAVFDNLTERHVIAYNANQWYHIEIKVNYTNKTFQIRIDGGDWSSSYAFYNGSTADQTDKIEFYHQTTIAHTLFFDTIGAAPPSAVGRSRGHIF